jgi:NADPH:quinone reductase-like Zn-dependent oxidoreductase
MPKMEAIKIQGPKAVKLVTYVPIPAIQPDYTLVKTHCVGVSPTDWKYIDFLASTNATSGCDYSDTIVEVGPDVSKPLRKAIGLPGSFMERTPWIQKMGRLHSMLLSSET